MYPTLLYTEANMLKHEVVENEEIFLFVNPYEVNPGNSHAQYGNSCIATSQTSPILVKTDSGDLSNCEFPEVPFRKVKVEMEEFSDLGDLIPSLRGKSVMDELSLPTRESEGMIDFTIRSYESSNLGDFIDTQDFHKNDYNQLYIDNQHINLEDTTENELYIIQKELSSGCANSELNEYFNNNNIESTIVKDKAPSNRFSFEDNRIANYITDHQYSNISSASDESVTPQLSPMETISYYGEEQAKFRRKLSEFNLGVKLFVGDTLNTPDILESVVSLEDERFNFLNPRNAKKLETINEDDFKFRLPISPETDSKYSITELSNSSEVGLKQSRKRKKYDDDDEDYIPPATQRTRKRAITVIETDSESEDEHIPVRDLKSLKRSRRKSSVSSNSSKDSSGVSKYRELRDKNNEASRKSRLKRKVKEKESEMEVQELEVRNVKLKAEVEELQRMVDNFRSNLFQIMMKK